MQIICIRYEYLKIYDCVNYFYYIGILENIQLYANYLY